MWLQFYKVNERASYKIRVNTKLNKNGRVNLCQCGHDTLIDFDHKTI